MKKKMQKGFSLVELMVVIAIIAILAAVAIPMYSNYTTRAKIGTELAKIGGTKADIADQIAQKGLRAGNTITGITSPSDMPGNVAVADNGAITLNLGNTAQNSAQPAATDDQVLPNDANATITITPNLVSGAVTWTCANGSGSTIATSQLPSPCN